MKPQMTPPDDAAFAHQDARKAGMVPLWEIYSNPALYPGRYLARLYLRRDTVIRPTGVHLVHSTLEGLRRLLPRSAKRLPLPSRPDIVESWK